MNIRSGTDRDEKAEDAAAKVRRAAENEASGTATERESSQADSDAVLAHGELERPKHHKGQPLPKSALTAALNCRIATFLRLLHDEKAMMPREFAPLLAPS